MSSSYPMPPRAVRWRSVLIFWSIAVALLAVFAAPFWFLPGGIAHPLYTWVIALGMLAPAVASLVVARVVDREPWRAAVGLRFRGRWGRIGLWIPLGVALVLAINAASSVIMVLRGVPGDLSGAAFTRTLTEQLADSGAELSPAAAVGLTAVTTALGILVTAVPALGEEIGWRGWLWRELNPLGFTAAIAVGGTLWSLWHLPITLIGHNYPGQPRALAVGMLIVACVAMNFLFGAITERAGGNPIPSAFAHATMNSTSLLFVSVVGTDRTITGINWFLDTPLGATGIVLIVIAAYAVWPRQARATFGPRTVDEPRALEDRPQ